MGGRIIVEGLQDGGHRHAGDDTAVDDKLRAAVADPRVGAAAAVDDLEAGYESAHGDTVDVRARADAQFAAVADIDVASAGVAVELDVRTLRCARNEAALVALAALPVVIVRLAP